MEPCFHTVRRVSGGCRWRSSRVHDPRNSQFALGARESLLNVGSIVRPSPPDSLTRNPNSLQSTNFAALSMVAFADVSRRNGAVRCPLTIFKHRIEVDKRLIGNCPARSFPDWFLLVPSYAFMQSVAII